MFSDVFPLKAVAFQILFLLIAISLEAIVLRRQLRLGYKTSMQYAASVNLLSIVIGWLVFFITEPRLPGELRTQLISYIFFDWNGWSRQMTPLLILIGFTAFFVTFLIKWLGLGLLERFLGKVQDHAVAAAANFHWQGRNRQGSMQEGILRPVTILMANVLSFSAITLVLVIRFLFQQPV